MNSILPKTSVDAVDSTQRERPTRNKQTPVRLNDCVMYDDTMDEEGEIIQLVMLAGAEPLNYQYAM